MIRSKIINLAPFINFWMILPLVISKLTYNTGKIRMLKQLGICEIIRSKCQRLWTLNDRVIWSVYIEFGVCEISASKLRAWDCDIAIVTISYKNWCLNWSKYHAGVFAFVNLYLGCVVKQDYDAVSQIFYFKINSVDISGLFYQNFIAFAYKHKVLFF